MALKTSACVLIAGAGDVGGRLAALRAGRGEQVIALRRRRMDPVAGIRTVQVDIASGSGLDRLPRQVDALVFCAAPDQRSEAAYRTLFLDGLRRLLDATDARRVLLVSSTAAYGEDAGEWVDEATPARPPAFNGRVLLEAERTLDLHPQGVALRLSGIYGPGRESLLRRARAGEANRPHWSNRIHVEDAAAALSFLLDIAAPKHLYLGNDDCPAREDEIAAWIRQREGLPLLPAAAGAETGRRVSNARLRVEGWAPRYPDFTAGYGPLLAPAGV